ncbi:DNA-binding NarL/FixJ family response regulator [Variovorax boronicumulans]|uniref:response regulator transcription factor n=1 Tax=Variovorax boronicumulans TaxID=436515 RepID=UPI002475FA72|nr:response regulator transcription factor [Variovorax boronicumulans]MDH6169215.1 DNA-binding NarL/FixJ family response regulator [Variovorax boronicumulans]
MDREYDSPRPSRLGNCTAPAQIGGLSALSANTPPPPGFFDGEQPRAVKVLLVDDDPFVRRVIAQELLGDLRIQLEGQAGSLREGRRLIMAHDFDVLLVDSRLGDGSGFDLVHEAKKRYSGAEVIVISAVEDETEVLHAFQLGASGFLLKNAWLQSYAQAVLHVVNGGAAITPRIARRLLLHLDHRRPRPDPVQPIETKAALSQREREVLQLVATGHVTGEIASQLTISVQTVSVHVKNIYRKLHAHTRAQAVSYATSRGLL